MTESRKAASEQVFSKIKIINTGKLPRTLLDPPKALCLPLSNYGVESSTRLESGRVMVQ